MQMTGLNGTRIIYTWLTSAELRIIFDIIHHETGIVEHADDVCDDLDRVLGHVEPDIECLYHLSSNFLPRRCSNVGIRLEQCCVLLRRPLLQRGEFVENAVVFVCHVNSMEVLSSRNRSLLLSSSSSPGKKLRPLLLVHLV